jgi:hypothetical protein
MVGDQKTYLQVNNTAAGFFPNVVNAAIGVFIPEASADTASEEKDAGQTTPKAVENAKETTQQAAH